MFDISFTELVIVALVGLIVLGPKRLPEVARGAGRWLARIRRFVSDVKSDIDRELDQAELAELRNLKQELDETRRAMEATSDRLIQQAAAVPSGDAASAAAPVPPPTTTPPTAPNAATPPAGAAPSAPRARRRTKQPKKKPTVSKHEHERN